MPSACEQLKGKELPNGWIVVEETVRYPGITGSAFSKGYIVEKDGTRAFMKAMDYSRAANTMDVAKALNEVTSVILFERRVLEICAQGNMSKIVRLIDGGTYKFPGHESDMMWQVEYFIFELAGSDVRKMLTFDGLGDAAWNLRILHQTAVGLTQLHGKGIAHQDLKPSNVLTVDANAKRNPSNEFKIGDLGRSSLRGMEGPHDHLVFAGDLAYITPEASYGHVEPDWVDRREAIDGFMLGNFMTFLFNGASMSSMIADFLPIQFHQGNWRGSYDQVLPHLTAAHAAALAAVAPRFPASVASELKEILCSLTYPDPKKRGDVRARASVGRQFGLNRYVSRLDRLAKVCDFQNRRRSN